MQPINRDNSRHIAPADRSHTIGRQLPMTSYPAPATLESYTDQPNSRTGCSGWRTSRGHQSYTTNFASTKQMREWPRHLATVTRRPVGVMNTPARGTV